MAGSRSALSKSLLVVQVAVSLMLLVGSGLFLRTLHNLRQVDVGFNPQNLLLFRINPSAQSLRREAADRAVHPAPRAHCSGARRPRRWRCRTRRCSRAASTRTGIFVRGRVYEPGLRDYNNSHQPAGDLDELLRDDGDSRSCSGAASRARDNDTAPKVAVINEAAAKKYFPNENPIGQHFGSSIETTNQLEVVGVLKDAKYNSVRDPAPPTMYVPYLQARAGSGVIEVRTRRRSGERHRRRARGRPPGRPDTCR